jgi:hypothetical protein
VSTSLLRRFLIPALTLDLQLGVVFGDEGADVFIIKIDPSIKQDADGHPLLQFVVLPHGICMDSWASTFASCGGIPMQQRELDSTVVLTFAFLKQGLTSPLLFSLLSSLLLLPSLLSSCSLPLANLFSASHTITQEEMRNKRRRHCW